MTNIEQTAGLAFSEAEQRACDALDRLMAPPDRTCRRCGAEASEFQGIVRLSAAAGSLDGYRKLAEIAPDVFNSAQSLCPSCWSGLLDFLGLSTGSES